MHRLPWVVALIASGALADGPAPAGASPAIRFESTTHDFGTIDSDKKQTFSWAYRNTGDATLEILNTSPSCGCTASVAEPRRVEPGAAGALAVTYDPAGQSGDVRKTLTVVTNDPAHPRTILTLRARVVPNEAETLANGHPRFTGQSLLMGSCAGCHATPSAGKTGAALWEATCAMCHGKTGEGGLAPGLRAPDYLASHDDAALDLAIAYGTSNPKMPGFSEAMGGPLNAGQVASLVKLLRTWGPISPRAPSPTPPKR
ncbi:MAG TPA: DUF1573 domain-containing protein [Candidatus Polarisedimenticolaceae bacterium]|nr:DUF1573 domain-containing protein [Candidatus Polarisedimenticolaceae bacterium]